MGKIYDYSDIENYRVPNSDGFVKAKTLVMDRLSEFVREGVVLGAKVYGSVAFGTHNERSDFDLLVITKNDLTLENDITLEILKNIFDDIYEKTSVDIEPKTVLDKSSAETGDHTINKIFYDNIGMAPNEGNIVGENPLEILMPANVTQFDSHEQYLIKKRETFKGGFLSRSSDEKCKSLQRALEAPVNMGREMLQMFPYLGYPDVLKDISKKAVNAKFTEIFGLTTNLSVGFRDLQTYDQDYSHTLSEALNGSMRRNEYKDYVDYLSETCIPIAINWTKAMKLANRKLVEGNYIFPEGNAVSHGGKESFR
jgi:hypothetical protein